MIRLLLLVAQVAGAQVLPQSIDDPKVSEVVDYLEQQLRRNRSIADNAGDDIRKATNTWTGSNTDKQTRTFDGHVVANAPMVAASTFQATTAQVYLNKGLVFGSSSPVTAASVGESVRIWAYSVSSATLSSGCVVSLQANANVANAYYTFTSTSTNQVQTPIGVLWENACSPGQKCRVTVLGMERVRCATGLTQNFRFITSATPCHVSHLSSVGMGTGGYLIQVADNGWCLAHVNSF